ncbi:MAG: transporter ATP-binding protein [Conexibacter sp.]|nr:transporter ATP-binding protein [Conexibacter sp.]
MSALAIAGLRKRYGRHEALCGVDLEVGEGELVGLLGPNGAGKSTLTKIACGLVHASEGTVSVAEPFGYLAELFRFPGWCTADEVLLLHQRLTQSPGGAAERAELLQLVRLEGDARTRVEAMSKGMQQRLGLAQAMIGSPKLLLLDEPTSALDPGGRRTVRDLLEELRRRGVAVLLNTHLLSEVEQVCDRVVIIDRGAVVAAGTPADLERGSGVEVELADGVRTFTGATRDEVPAIVADLVAAGEEVYGVRVVRSTLEDVYLDTVADAR